MSRREDDDFRPKLGAPRDKGRKNLSRPARFTSRVLRAVAKNGGGARSSLKRPYARPGAQAGRGQVAARLVRQSLGTRARRVVIKTRLVVAATASPTSTRYHLAYIQRDGVSQDGERGRLYSADLDVADGGEIESRSRDDRHQFRFIVSAEDGADIGDLQSYTRDLMGRMERDLGTKLDWVAVDHWDTDEPHTHVLLRGKDELGEDLIIAREYIAHGMRARAREVATDWLGPRTEIEIRAALVREVTQERWNSLDQAIQHDAFRNAGKEPTERAPASDRSGDFRGRIDLRRETQDKPLEFHKSLQVGRLQHLEKMGLAQESQPGIWSVHRDFETTLRAMGERGDIIRRMQRTFTRERREFAIFDPHRSTMVVGRVVQTGRVDELQDRRYLIVDSTDGRAHHVTLPTHVKLEDVPIGSIVEIGNEHKLRPADRNIQSLARDGIYRVSDHLAAARGRERDPEGFVQTHVRRLEALRRARIVERLDADQWRVPADLPARGQAYDLQRNVQGNFQLRVHVPLDQQRRAIAATWLDRQLVARSDSLAGTGFGKEVRDALTERATFLIEQGFALRQGQRVVLISNLLATLQSRELETAGKELATETGLTFRAAEEGERVSGTYRRTIQLLSGRFAMLDDGLGFTLVPWRPVIDKSLGRSLTAAMRGQSVSWELGRDHGLSL